MSRNSKEVVVNGKPITVFELTVKDIKKLWSDITGGSPEAQGVPFFSNDAIIRNHWTKCIHGVTLEETEDMAPSELKLIYDAFAEVNAIFFDLALKLEGEDPFLKSLRVAVFNDLMLRFAASSPEVTQESGTTDTVSLS